MIERVQWPRKGALSDLGFSRRRLIFGAAALFLAPSIVRASSIMPISTKAILPRVTVRASDLMPYAQGAFRNVLVRELVEGVDYDVVQKDASELVLGGTRYYLVVLKPKWWKHVVWVDAHDGRPAMVLLQTMDN